MSEATKANLLGMSDEDFLNKPLADIPLDSSDEAADAALDSTDGNEITDDAQSTESDESTDSTDNSSVEDQDSSEDTDEDEETESTDEANDDENTETSDEEEDSDEETESAEKDSTQESSESETDYKAFYDQITGKFKANGREMQVDSPEDIIQLMQMGANYAKKMAALKPSLKTLKVLEKNELLDEDKLGYLIDLYKKNPDAIKKLLKDSKLDPLDIDIDETNNYQPTKYSVEDSEMVMDEVIGEIRDTPTYTQTLDIVSNKWDDASRQIIATNPQILTVINEHVSNGVYERVWAEVERERTLGRLSGVSDFEAYKTIGDHIFGQGEPASSAPKNKVVARKKAGESDATRNRKKQAASPSRNKTSKSKGQDFNPLSMSDEEFLKSFDSKYA